MVATLTPMQRTVFALFLLDPPSVVSDLESMTEYVRTAVLHLEQTAQQNGMQGHREDMELLRSVLIMLEASAELMRINVNASAGVKLRQAQSDINSL